jgi:hypothetical protein
MAGRKAEATKSLDQKEQEWQTERTIRQIERQIRLEKLSSQRQAEGTTAEGEEVMQDRDVQV